MKGYAGQITHVDLSTGKIRNEKFNEEFARKYLGGNGFAARTLIDSVPSGADPLGEENVLIFCTGPLTGTLAHGSGRAGIVTKSPLTGYFMDSYFGGEWGARLKQSGRDMLVISGKSPHPVVLFCDDDIVELIEAEDLWGLTTLQVQERLKQKLGTDIRTVCCGPAGEKQVSMACCIGGRRAAGRGGTGAVMGSKNLKAVSIRGTQDIQVADIKSLLRHYLENKEKFSGLKGFVEVGTPFLVKTVNAVGGLGTHNWQTENWDKADNISGERLLADHSLRIRACYACNLGGCTRVVRSNRDPAVVTEGPEYETLFALGSNCGVDDLDEIIETDRLCDDYGIDTVSFGGAVGFAMECFQRGLLTGKDTGGLDFCFGNGDALIAAAHLVAGQEGFGIMLGRGVKSMAAQIGRSSDRFACHIRGLEPPGHSARALKVMGIGYAVSTRGGSHHDVRPSLEYRLDREQRSSTKGKVRMAYDTADWSAVRDSMIVCSFCEGVFGFMLGQDHVDLINHTVGWDLTLAELAEIGCRIHTLERSFNCREGLRRKDDTVPYRFMHEKIPDGNSKGLRLKPEELQQMLDDYYERRGWDENGVPTAETLGRLGLGDVVI
ncbi:MAG: aldehyde ferredoxin oxidoreductase family protein [bacterium]|nr:aldehyde ferredoxin oxidoreductase family protein [bacterium]